MAAAGGVLGEGHTLALWEESHTSAPRHFTPSFWPLSHLPTHLAVDWGLLEMFPFMARIRSSQFGHRWEGSREQRAPQSYSREQPKSAGGPVRARTPPPLRLGGHTRHASQRPVTHGAHAWQGISAPTGLTWYS